MYIYYILSCLYQYKHVEYSRNIKYYNYELLCHQFTGYHVTVLYNFSTALQIAFSNSDFCITSPCILGFLLR